MMLRKDKTPKKKQASTDDFDFETFRQKVIASLMEGKMLTGHQGLLKPLIANFIESALDAEMQHHLEEQRA